eukprot:gb/GEZN01008167.1/.p1 GENE.gb/GEZN01008167.1/~~gb/GEZN01008167.1/.p1  ORF type:complete len:358 (+),score=50.20 gb/GEZN01008167.1/:256-1329(+)
MGNSLRSEGKEFRKSYNMRGKIGTGGFAVVRKCVRKADRKQFAAKIICKDEMKNRENSSNDEVLIMRMIQHPHVIKLEQVFDTKTKLILVLELMSCDLSDRLTDAYTEKQAAEITRGIASALAHLHARGITHRDLKPENVLLVRKEGTEVKLTDFGTAKYRSDPEAKMTSACGSPSYVAPEILCRRKYGSEVDIWSLGVILFRLISGELPFNAPEGNRKLLYEMIKRGQYSFNGPLWNKKSKEEGGVIHLIKRCLTIDAKARITATEVLQHKWIVSLAGSSPGDSSPSPRLDLFPTPPACCSSAESTTSQASTGAATQQFLSLLPASPNVVDNTFKTHNPKQSTSSVNVHLNSPKQS